MYNSSRPKLALLSAIAIGAINVASISVIYIVIHDARKSTGPVLTHGAPSSGAGIVGEATNKTNRPGTPANGTVSSPKNSQSSSAGIGSPSKSPVSGGKSTSPATPPSLVKGPPCKTQVPPAGVCAAVLSINTQKDGNPSWNPSLLAAIKQQIASNSYVQLFGLDPTTVYNSIQVSIDESTWSGNATHGTINGTTSGQGQSQLTTFTLDWNGSKWIVNEAKLD